MSNEHLMYEKCPYCDGTNGVEIKTTEEWHHSTLWGTDDWEGAFEKVIREGVQRCLDCKRIIRVRPW